MILQLIPALSFAGLRHILAKKGYKKSQNAKAAPGRALPLHLRNAVSNFRLNDPE